MMDHWKMIEKFSYEKKIIRGEGLPLLDTIATSTLYKEYHQAFCELVRIVEETLDEEEEVVASSSSGT
jgi:hypothetical protein